MAGEIRLAVDTIAHYDKGIVLVDRAEGPYGKALPGGFLELGETLEQAASRELNLKTDLMIRNLSLYQPFSELGRDPRGQIVTQVFYGDAYGKISPGRKVYSAFVATPEEIEEMKNEFAFDHYKILKGFLEAQEKKDTVRSGLPEGELLWQVHYKGRYWSNGSYGGPEFAGWEPVDHRYYVLARNIDEALRKAQKEYPKILKKKLNDDEEIVVSPIPLENLAVARNASEDGRRGWISTRDLEAIELSVKKDKENYLLGAYLFQVD